MQTEETKPPLSADIIENKINTILGLFQHSDKTFNSAQVELISLVNEYAQQEVAIALTEDKQQAKYWNGEFDKEVHKNNALLLELATKTKELKQVSADAVHLTNRINEYKSELEDLNQSEAELVIPRGITNKITKEEIKQAAAERYPYCIVDDGYIESNREGYIEGAMSDIAARINDLGEFQSRSIGMYVSPEIQPTVDPVLFGEWLIKNGVSQITETKYYMHWHNAPQITMRELLTEYIKTL